MTADQRGELRPTDGDGDAVATCDVGAFEAAAVAPVQHLLEVTVAGAGAGSVTSLPVGIDCPGDCDESWVLTQNVELTATPDPGSYLRRLERRLHGQRRLQLRDVGRPRGDGDLRPPAHARRRARRSGERQRRQRSRRHRLSGGLQRRVRRRHSGDAHRDAFAGLLLRRLERRLARGAAAATSRCRRTVRSTATFGLLRTLTSRSPGGERQRRERPGRHRLSVRLQRGLCPTASR